MGRPADWWPLRDADPVPGDPEVLAGLGRHLANAAAEIERMAAALPRISASRVWDSDAGAQFRAKAAGTATSIGKAYGRFRAVATALGSSTYGGGGYAPALQECQEQADAALTAVSGTMSNSGSEAGRRRAWTRLLDATGGLDPTRPLPETGGGTAAIPASVLSAFPVTARVPAGPMPLARPGFIPPYLPGFTADPPDVAALKGTYNAAVDVLRSSARAITQATADQATAAQQAAALIRTAINSDGLNNPSGFLHWLDHATDDVAGYVSAHWAGFVTNLAKIAGDIATVCGIIAMVLAFIPGLQEFAALFETVALLAQAVAFVLHTALLLSGHGSLSDVLIDGVGLITFGIGKGLIGGAETVSDISEAAGRAYQGALENGDSVSAILQAGDSAIREATGATRVSMVSKMMDGVKDSFSVRTVFSGALKAPDEVGGKALGNNLLGKLGGGLRDTLLMKSPEIGSALANAAKAADDMPYAKGVGWALETRVEVYGNLFRVTQGLGVGTDMAGRLDTALNAAGVPVPGYDSIKDWPQQAGG